MKRLLARVGLPMLAAAILTVANLPAASADPAYGSENRCSGPVWVKPDISVNTCTYFFWWDYGAHHSHRSRVTVYNGGSWGPVAVTPELEVGFSVHRSGTTYIYAGQEQEVLGDYIQDIPSGTHVQGRGGIWTYYWSTTTLAPRFP